jgi:hypothetical protein
MKQRSEIMNKKDIFRIILRELGTVALHMICAFIAVALFVTLVYVITIVPMAWRFTIILFYTIIAITAIRIYQEIKIRKNTLANQKYVAIEEEINGYYQALYNYFEDDTKTSLSPELELIYEEICEDINNFEDTLIEDDFRIIMLRDSLKKTLAIFDIEM